MRLVIFLEHQVPAFRASAEQLQRFRMSIPSHDLIVCQDRAEFLRQLPSADAVIVWSFPGDWYASAQRLERIFTPAAGRELIAPDPCGRSDVYHGTFHGRIMAESLLAMMGFINRRLDHAQEAQRRHAWDYQGYSAIRRLAGQTALLVGYGNIGRYCGRLLKAVGMRVHAFKRDVLTGTRGADRVFGPGQLSGAVADADHIVCLLPGDTGADRLIDKDVFMRMKSTAALYNLGRGNVIDSLALQEALSTGHIAAAYLDVLPEEPLSPASSLWSTPNLFISPHVSAITADYLDLYFEELASILEDVSG